MTEALEKLQPSVLAHIENELAALDAEARIAWALEHLPGNHAVSSSFGAQAAVMLHLVSRLQPDIPIILVDTGYLFPETYRFADELCDRLKLNLKIYRSKLSPAWQETRYGKLWEQGRDGIEQYNRINKTEPMRRALDELEVTTWFAGLRRDQSRSRAATHLINQRNGRYKVHPIADWRDRDIGEYLNKHNLPYHPLWEQGYISIGDTHTTTRWQPGVRAEATRFFGIKRECGLHQDV